MTARAGLVTWKWLLALLLGTLAVALLPSCSWGADTTSLGSLEATESPAQSLTLVVMDPLAAPLSCPCVEGYAQRDYQKLAEFIQQRTGRSVLLVFKASLTEALKKTRGKADLIIGKHSVVKHDAAMARLKVRPLARLTGKDGKTTQTGLILVRAQDPAQSLADLAGYRFLLGPEASEEKHAAAKQLLATVDVEIPKEVETSEACSDGACKLIEWGDDVRAATVISSYAKPLLEGCGTISKGDLRVVGETEPVPFITAFVNEKLPRKAQQEIEAALLAVVSEKELRASLESLLGFVQVKEKQTVKKK